MKWLFQLDFGAKWKSMKMDQNNVREAGKRNFNYSNWKLITFKKPNKKLLNLTQHVNVPHSENPNFWMIIRIQDFTEGVEL